MVCLYITVTDYEHDCLDTLDTTRIPAGESNRHTGKGKMVYQEVVYLIKAIIWQTWRVRAES